MLEVVDPAVVVTVDRALSLVVLHTGGVEVGDVVAVIIVGQLGVPIFRWILDFRLNTVMTKNKFSWLFYLRDNF